MSRQVNRSLPEEALERTIQLIDGPVNRRVERLLKRRLLLAPAGLFVTLTARGYVALRDLEPRALLGTKTRALLETWTSRKDGAR